jgi:pterin-4a-carbinolamine dehydratase
MAEDKGVLGVEEVDAELESLDGWSREGVIISRDFVLANFGDITAFLQHLVGTIAAQNHHPDFSLDTGTRTVAVSVTTHSEGAVTRADINFARALNTWSAQG